MYDDNYVCLLILFCNNNVPYIDLTRINWIELNITNTGNSTIKVHDPFFSWEWSDFAVTLIPSVYTNISRHKLGLQYTVPGQTFWDIWWKRRLTSKAQVLPRLLFH
jgi:hypothetical protein